MRHLVLAAACTAALAFTSSSLTAQGPGRRPAGWAVVDAIGYGGLGVGTSLLLVWDMEFGDAYAVMIGAGAAGMVTGAVLGTRARRNVREGRHTGIGHRNAALAGAVFAGATLGALAAVPLIGAGGDLEAASGEGESGTFLGSDETTVAITMLGGTVIGAVYAMKNRDDFDASRLSVAPYRSRERTAGLRVRVTF